MCQAPSYWCVHLVLDCQKRDMFRYIVMICATLKLKKNIRTQWCFSLIYCLFLLMLLHLSILSPCLSQQVEVNGPSFDCSVLRNPRHCTFTVWALWTVTAALPQRIWVLNSDTVNVLHSYYLCLYPLFSVSSKFHPGLEREEQREVFHRSFWAILYFFCTCHRMPAHLRSPACLGGFSVCGI